MNPELSICYYFFRKYLVFFDKKQQHLEHTYQYKQQILWTIFRIHRFRIRENTWWARPWTKLLVHIQIRISKLHIEYYIFFTGIIYGWDITSTFNFALHIMYFFERNENKQQILYIKQIVSFRIQNSLLESSEHGKKFRVKILILFLPFQNVGNPLNWTSIHNQFGHD